MPCPGLGELEPPGGNPPNQPCTKGFLLQNPRILLHKLYKSGKYRQFNYSAAKSISCPEDKKTPDSEIKIELLSHSPPRGFTSSSRWACLFRGRCFASPEVKSKACQSRTCPLRPFRLSGEHTITPAPTFGTGDTTPPPPPARAAVLPKTAPTLLPHPFLQFLHTDTSSTPARCPAHI